MLCSTSNSALRRYKMAALTYAFALVIPSLSAQADHLASPESHGMSSDRLGRISQHMNNALERGELVGGLGLIARDGQIVYQQSYGLADRSPTRAMSADTLFRIYSMSKPITSVAVLMLYEEGRFALNDPIGQYIPELANLQLALSTADSNDQLMLSDGTSSKHLGAGDASKAGQTRPPLRQPTIRDLLTHTAGFTYGLFGNTEVDKLYRVNGLGLSSGDMTLEELVSRLGKLPLQYEPGSRWHYSVATDVLARLVEVVSGMKFGDFLQERVFTPLTMTDTSFTVAETKWARMAQLYAPSDIQGEIQDVFLNGFSAKTLEEAPESFDSTFKPGAQFQSGGGGLISTAGDYFRFCQMLLNGGQLDGRRLLSPKTVQLMTSNHLGERTDSVFSRAGTGFGLGVAVTVNQAAIGELGTTGEYNWGGAAGTKFWIDPTEGLIGIFMTQSVPHVSHLGVDFKYLTYQAITDSHLDKVDTKLSKGLFNRLLD